MQPKVETMALRVILSCDFPIDDGKCEGPASMKFSAELGDRCFRADFCDDHRVNVERALRDIGATPEAVLVDSKRRGAHVAKSGATFSTAEARTWLREEGLVASAHGRVSKELLQIYADAH